MIFAKFALIFLSLNAYCDWEADLEVKMNAGERGKREMKGHIRAKDFMQRMDIDGPQKITLIMNMKSHKAWNLMHAQKSALEMDLSKMSDGAQLPQCSISQIDECFKKQGLTKVGSEKVGQYDCDIYEKKADKADAKGRRAHFKVWRPKLLKEVPAVKSLVFNETGETIVETMITNVQNKTQEKSQFELPKGYNLLNLDALMKTMGKKQ